MTIDVSVLQERFRQLADQAAAQARGRSEQGDEAEAQFQSGRHAAFLTALHQVRLSEEEAARERDQALASNIRDEQLGEEAARLGVIGRRGVAVDLGAVERLEEFARQAGGAVDMASGEVHSDADGGL